MADDEKIPMGSEQSREDLIERLKFLAENASDLEITSFARGDTLNVAEVANEAAELLALSTAHAEGLGKGDMASRADSATRLASQGCDTDAPHSAGFQVHILKTHPGPFAAVRARVKKLEIRRDDRGYSVGDTLWLEEFDPETEARSGEVEVRLVTHVLPGGQYGIEPGYVAMSVEEIRPSSEARDELSLALARQRELETEREEWKNRAHGYELRLGNLGRDLTTAEAKANAAETRQRELEEALREIVAFCDDPEGSERWESLAMGLSRLLPKARALLSPPTQNGADHEH